MRTNCTNPACGREFVATKRFIETAGGLCRNCASTAESVDRLCQDCEGTFKEYPQFLRKIGAFAGIRLRCPTCHDRQAGKAPRDVVEERECLFNFRVVRIEIDLEAAEKLPNYGVSGRPAAKTILRNYKYPVKQGALLVYDFRLDGNRGKGSLALVRVMRVRHSAGTFDDPEFKYLVLEPLNPADAGRAPEGKLVFADWHWDREHRGALLEDDALWSTEIGSRSRMSSDSACSLIAIVSEEHPVKVLQDGNEIVFS